MSAARDPAVSRLPRTNLIAKTYEWVDRADREFLPSLTDRSPRVTDLELLRGLIAQLILRVLVPVMACGIGLILLSNPWRDRSVLRVIVLAAAYVGGVFPLTVIAGLWLMVATRPRKRRRPWLPRDAAAAKTFAPFAAISRVATIVAVLVGIVWAIHDAFE